MLTVVKRVGVLYWCRACAALRRAQTRARTKTPNNARTDGWGAPRRRLRADGAEEFRCTWCGGWKDREAFTLARGWPEGVLSHCRACTARRNMPNGARRRAKHEGVPFLLHDRRLLPHAPERCPCGWGGISLGNGALHIGSPTLDRAVPRLGYVLGNVSIISLGANAAKGRRTPEELWARARALVRDPSATIDDVVKATLLAGYAEDSVALTLELEALGYFALIAEQHAQGLRDTVKTRRPRKPS